MAPDFSRATAAHAVQLAEAMRPGDVLECEALGFTPLAAVQESLRVSDASVALHAAGELLAIGGYRLTVDGPVLGVSCAVAWVLTTTAVDRHPLAFHRGARAWLRAMRAHADVLWNHVDARYAASLRWLDALGFVTFDSARLGPAGLPFHLVVRGV